MLHLNHLLMFNWIMADINLLWYYTPLDILKTDITTLFLNTNVYIRNFIFFNYL